MFRHTQPVLVSCLLCIGLGACGARRANPRDPTDAVDMEAMRIVARSDGHGGYQFASYDAAELFRRANLALDAGKCADAVVLYDRIVSEFPDSPHVSPSLYNAGLCLAQTHKPEPALEHFQTLLTTLPDSPDVRHASFQAGHLSVELERWEAAVTHADRLLGDSDLPADERVEAMAIRGQALLGLERLEKAAQQAREGLQYYRIQGPARIPDEYFAASLNFILAESIRATADAMIFPDTTQEEQRAVLVRRAELLLEAQRAYFDTIRHTHPHWAAAAGHRIGQLYDKLWHDLMASPVPQHLSDGAKSVYHGELAKLIKPLLRHAVRYWELTLMMIERTGVDTPWAEQTHSGLDRTRALLLEQPPGPGGLPTSPPQTDPPDQELAPDAIPAPTEP